MTSADMRTIICISCKKGYPAPALQSLNTCPYCGGKTLTKCKLKEI